MGRLCSVAAGLIPALVVSLVLAPPDAARAQVTCAVPGTSPTFGTVNPYSGYPYSTSVNVGASCRNNGTQSATVFACVSIGTGTGGTTAANRTLASQSATLPIQITGGASSPGQIGDGTAYPMEGPFAFTVPAHANVATPLPLTVTIPQPSAAPPPGTYISSFSGTDQENYFTASSAPATCAALVTGAPQTVSGHIVITASVPTQCTVSATSLAFPAASVLTNPVSATATISVTCNASTPVTIALDNGATGTGPTTRQMRSGSNAITYGIYRDAAATLPWGNTQGTNTASLSGGTGTLTAYGRVAAQASPPPGSYADVVNVVITY